MIGKYREGVVPLAQEETSLDEAGREAVSAYGRAMELAAGHGARSAELRAALRRCRLPGRAPSDADRAHLRRLYDQFEEGFATPDLQAAKALLEGSG